jgi:hypothetical protein
MRLSFCPKATGNRLAIAFILIKMGLTLYAMTQPSQQRARDAAFTRIEMAALIAALALFCAVALPLIGATRSESARIGCFSNLRQLGAAARVWGNDHGDRFPWITPEDEGGTRPATVSKSANAWVEWITLSNEITSPHLLACPSDAATKVASHWGNTTGGFANSGFRGQSLSYFIGYHGEPQMPRSVITGDRDFRPSSTTPVGCAFGNAINTLNCNAFSGTTIAWTNAVHSAAGHLLFVDGGVEFVNSARLRSALVGDLQSDNSSIHFINAR